MTEDPVAVLREVFGFPAFRGLQETAVRHVIGGGDALVLMPTGGGKSVCYQVPALCREGTAVVISPLIALMDDQVAALRQLGVAAGALHSEIGEEEARRVGGLLERGTLDLLYMSPERLLSGGTLDRLARRRIALIAIDEAHCVSQWGHEFRPEYRALRRLPERFAGVPRVALTATADPRTRADILDALGMDHAAVFAASFHRANLHIAAEAKTGGPEQLAGVLRGRAEQTGIVYCGSRAKVDQVATSLSQRGLPALAFHAGLTPHHKRGALEKFRSGDAVVMVATIAFGMGIDRPDVRFVAHLDMPDSPEAYYQQIGRAGRDGLRADTLLLYGAQDIARARHWLSQSVAPEAEKQIRRQRLESMISLAETAACRTAALLACFGETLSGPLRPLRQLRDARHPGGRDGGCAEGDLRHRPHRPALRRLARGQRAHRQADGDGDGSRPRPLAHVRRRQRPSGDALARRHPPASGTGHAGQQRRRPADPAGGDGQGPRNPTRRNHAHAPGDGGRTPHPHTGAAFPHGGAAGAHRGPHGSRLRRAAGMARGGSANAARPALRDLP